eukprot:13397556-Heterocapsa_arctica.AAC.1
MTPDGSGNLLFPSHMPCVVVHNLNECFATQGKGDKWQGLRAEHEWPEIAALMNLMKMFRSKLYICTASAAHWEISEYGQGPKYDDESRRVRDLAKEKGIMSWTGQ